MPTIQAIRQQYPQYSDMSDQQLADALHAKYYSDMPQEQFYKKIDLSTPPAQADNQLTDTSLIQTIGKGLKNYYQGEGNTLAGIAHGLNNVGNQVYEQGVDRPIDALFGTNYRTHDQALDAQNNAAFNQKYADSALAKVGNFVGNVAPIVVAPEAAGIDLAAAPAAVKGLMGLPDWLTNAAGIVGKNTAYGAAANMLTGNSPVTGGIAAGIGSGLTHGLSKALPAAWNAGKNYLSQYAAQGFSKRIADDLNPVTNLTNQQAFNLAKQNFDSYGQREKGAWDNLSDTAKQADASGAKFDNQDYLVSLKNKLQELQGQSGRQSGFTRANNDGQSLLQGYLDDQHGTFTDAIEHNKALNQDYQNEITPGKSLPFNIVNYAKSNINKVINDNIKNNGLSSVLGDAWDNANAITAQKNKIFNEVVNPSGNQQISSFSKFAKNNNSDYQDPTSFVKDYIPTTRGDGIQKMQQFAQMLGNENTAKNVIKMNYFDNSLNKDGIEASKFLTKYHNLSSDQQNYLFSSEQNKTIQALAKAVGDHPGSSDINGLAIKTILGGLGGFGIGHALGTPEIGTLAGAAAIPVTKFALSKALENSTLSNYFRNYLTRNTQASVPRTGLAGSAMNRMLTPTILQGVNNFNTGGIAGMSQ
jgi:hypothetical protein